MFNLVDQQRALGAGSMRMIEIFGGGVFTKCCHVCAGILYNDKEAGDLGSISEAHHMLTALRQHYHQGRRGFTCRFTSLQGAKIKISIVDM